MKNFKDFLDTKSRTAKHQLGLIKKMLEHQGVKVRDHLGNDDPYLFVKNPTGKKTEFDGVRLYKVGDALAYRVQKEESTHPYGIAYPLDIETTFDDLLGDMKEEKAGEMIIKALAREIKTFFEKSSTAEDDIRDADTQKDGANPRYSTSDYSTMINNPMN
jgi:hypothetical protein